MISESSILRKIGQQPKQSAGLKQLVRELGVRGDERRAFSAQLDELVRRGELVAHDGDRYSIPKKAAARNLVSGRLTMHRDGYGFVIPDSEELRLRLNGDIYISPQNTDNAMHGDRVLVELRKDKDRGDGRAEGQIVKVIGRAHATVVGTFHYGARYNYVTPMDEKITLDIVIPHGAEIPETIATEDMEESMHRSRQSVDGSPARTTDYRLRTTDRVLGAEAKRTEVAEDLENVVVDVEITEWPSPTQNPRGRVVEILGYEDDFGVDVEIVIRKYHLPHRFPAAVLAEAQAFDTTIPDRELRGRRDYRTLPVVTIDGETARDFDDAVFVRRMPNGNFELQVHIADVAQYVHEASALDAEARLRGNSVYFPDRAVPMLPIELSTDLCSLRPHLDRLVMSCVMEIDSKGDIVGYEISPGVIRSAERMTYTDVNAILDHPSAPGAPGAPASGDAKLRERYHALVDGFELMRELAMILNRKRVRRGSIDFDLPEPVIEFDEFGLMKTITRSERNFAHRLIEEFMLAANESVASYLENKGVESLYRIHEKPDPKRVYEFESIAVAFGYSLGVGALPVKRFHYTDQRRPGRGPGRTRSGQQRHEMEIPQDVPITPRMYQKLTEKIAGKPEERILSYLMLRSLKQAKYSEENVGHFALAAPTYTHFTSPIRRYPDLIVHRILKEVLRDSAEKHDGHVPVGVGVLSDTRGAWAKDRSQESGVRSQREQLPWGKGSPKKAGHGKQARDTVEGAIATYEGPIAPEVLHEIALESSESERRADDAERELMEWKKIKFMQDRVGEDFEGLIISVTKFGFFVELMDMFIEGLVPLSTLTGDLYTYHDSTKQIIGERTRKKYSLGDRVRVILDRIDSVQRKLQFAVVEEKPTRAPRRHKR